MKGRVSVDDQTLCVIKFYSNGCHLCHALSTYYKDISDSEKYENVLFFAFNVDDDDEITQKLNLHSRWPNIHCGMAEMNRLYVYPGIEGDWEKVIKYYNSGTHVLEDPIRYARGERMNKKHLKRVKYFRKILLDIIEEYKITSIN